MTNRRGTIRRIAAALVLSALTLPGPSMAAPSERDRYERHVRQYASPGKLDRKRMCACVSSDPALDGTAGYLVSVARPLAPYNVVLTCFIPEFDDTGALVDATDCPAFVPLLR